MEEKIKKDIISKSTEQTQKIAADLASNLKGGQILALTGDLGGGKTTFVQGLAKGFRIKKQITSPSFVLVKEYRISKQLTVNSKQQIANKLIHIDLYRLKKIDEVLQKEISEYFKPENICVIEWAEKIKDALPKNTQWIKFDFVDENRRKIIFK